MSESVEQARRCIRIICKACSGTGKSRYHEGRDCDQCDGHGTILSYVSLSR